MPSPFCFFLGHQKEKEKASKEIRKEQGKINKKQGKREKFIVFYIYGLARKTRAAGTFSAKFRPSEADRRIAFILPSRFWFFLGHQKEKEKGIKRNKNGHQKKKKRVSKEQRRNIKRKKKPQNQAITEKKKKNIEKKKKIYPNIWFI